MRYLCCMTDFQGLLENTDLHTGWSDPLLSAAVHQSKRAPGSQLAGQTPTLQGHFGVQVLQ